MRTHIVVIQILESDAGAPAAQLKKRTLSLKTEQLVFSIGEASDFLGVLSP